VIADGERAPLMPCQRSSFWFDVAIPFPLDPLLICDAATDRSHFSDHEVNE
jgi:hypothetical protein